ncbi:MAG: DUF1499 domain-containing protein [Rhodomicrobium sp.]
MARWSYRIAVLAILVFAGVFVWHRFFGLATPLALKAFGAAVAVALISLTLAAAALVNIWNDGSLGAGRAGFALFLSLLLLAVPLWSLPDLLNLPRIYDVTTDPGSPPAFDRIAKIRQGQANSAHYDPSFRPLQMAAYPDIKALIVSRPLVDVYSAVRETVKALNWKVIDEQAPEGGRTGYMEAVDRTWIFGFTDDVAIRVTGSARAAKIDIRSSSRFGQHDLGRNARRIRLFLGEIKSRLAEIERAERMERLVASREAAEKAAEKEESKRHRGGRRRDADSED